MRTTCAPHQHRISTASAPSHVHVHVHVHVHRRMCAACAPHVHCLSRTAASGKSSVRRPCFSSPTRSASSSSTVRRTGTCLRRSSLFSFALFHTHTLPLAPPLRPPCALPFALPCALPCASSIPRPFIPNGARRGAGWGGTSGSSRRGPLARWRLARTPINLSPPPRALSPPSRATAAPLPSPRPCPPRSPSPAPTPPPWPPT